MVDTKIIRCSWCGTDPLYTEYHDKEWGKHVTDEKTLFEFLILESAQAGLSWITILRRRAGYREAFAHFDYHKVAAYDLTKIEALSLDPEIIRHKGKIAAAVGNAKIFIAIQREFGTFYNYLYSFMPHGVPVINSLKVSTDGKTRSEESDALSKDLKKRGFKFFGTTICYAYMQAVGMVNDHINTCTFKNSD